jgi:hypothetical protein
MTVYELKTSCKLIYKKWVQAWQNGSKICHGIFKPWSFVKCLKRVVKCCLNWTISMVISIFMLSTQMYKMRSSQKKVNARKQMTKFGFGHKFHDL